MTPHHPIDTPEAPLPIGPYSQAMVCNGLLYTSGQIALTPDGQLNNHTIEDEVAQVLANLTAVLAAAHTDWGHVIKTTVYLTDMAYFDTFNTQYHQLVSVWPARTTIQVAGLPKGARIEVELVARIP